MRVKRVSLVSQRVLKKAGMRAHTPPNRAPARAMAGRSTGAGRLSAQWRASQVAPTAPAVIWPSAPMFQNFILKQGAMARAVPSRGTAMRAVCRMAVGLPSAPERMVP